MVTEAFEQSGAPVRLQVVAMASRPCSSSTGLAASPDVQLSYPLHASAYVSQPADFDGFTDAIRQIARWFLELIALPRPS